MPNCFTRFNIPRFTRQGIIVKTSIIAAVISSLLLSGSIVAQTADRSNERQQYQQAQAALAAREMEQFHTLRKQLAETNYPLLSYLDYAELEPRLDSLPFDDVEQFLAAVALFVVVMFYVIQGLRILVNENKTAGQAYRQLKRLLGETEDQ